MSTERNSLLVIGFDTNSKELFQILTPLLIEYNILVERDGQLFHTYTNSRKEIVENKDLSCCISDFVGNIIYNQAVDDMLKSGDMSFKHFASNVFGNKNPTDLIEYYTDYDEQTQFGIAIKNMSLSAENTNIFISYAIQGLERLFEKNGLHKSFPKDKIRIFSTIKSF